MATYPQRKSGFSLIQISVLLTVASLLLVATLPGYQSQLTSNKNSTNRLNNVLSAVRNFQLANGRLPCPADAGIMVGSTNYGVEAANQNANCTGGTPAANVYSNNVAIGMVPVQTLGLSNDAALDDYGRYITYGVDTTATGCWAASSLPGKILVDSPDYGASSKAFTKNPIIALVSHGADGHGALLPAVSAGVLNRFNAGSSDTDEALNAHVTAGGVSPTNVTQGADSNNVTATFVRKKPTSGFDDLVVYGNNTWNMNSMPSALTTATTLTSRTTDGTYGFGQTLTFTFTTPQPVTVSPGTMPRLAITAITNATYPSAVVGTTVVNGVTTGYATYTGATNTPTTSLTFSYPILVNDSAPAGIAISSPLDMNGGGAFVNPCFTFFSPPDLSKVIIGSYIYLTDVGHNRIVKMDMNGNYKATFGTGTTGKQQGQFSGLMASTVDSSGNVWATDSNAVDRVQEFSPNGTWAMTVGGASNATCEGTYKTVSTCNKLSGYTGTCCPLSTTCTCASGSSPVYPSTTGVVMFNFTAYGGQLSFDSSGNLWIADGGNNRVVKINPSTGAFVDQISTANSGPLLKGNPYGVAVDPSSGAVWVMSPGSANNCELEKCTYTSSWSCSAVASTCGSTGGHFYDNSGENDYIMFDNSGHAWVTDESNCRVQEFTASTGAYVTSVTVPGAPGACSAANGVTGAAPDNNGNIWVMNAYASPNSTLYKLRISDNASLITPITTANSIAFSNSTNVTIAR